jgi:hypothetical protein
LLLEGGQIVFRVDSEIHHAWASILSFVIWRSLNRCEHGSGGPLLHGIRYQVSQVSFPEIR